MSLEKIEQLAQSPEWHARDIATELNINFSTTQNKLYKLYKEGRIPKRNRNRTKCPPIDALRIKELAQNADLTTKHIAIQLNLDLKLVQSTMKFYARHGHIPTRNVHIARVWTTARTDLFKKYYNEANGDHAKLRELASKDFSAYLDIHKIVYMLNLGSLKALERKARDKELLEQAPKLIAQGYSKRRIIRELKTCSQRLQSLGIFPRSVFERRNPEIVKKILELGSTHTRREIATMYNITRSKVSGILRDFQNR